MSFIEFIILIIRCICIERSIRTINVWPNCTVSLSLHSRIVSGKTSVNLYYVHTYMGFSEKLFPSFYVTAGVSPTTYSVSLYGITLLWFSKRQKTGSHFIEIEWPDDNNKMSAFWMDRWTLSIPVLWARTAPFDGWTSYTWPWFSRTSKGE